MGSVGRGSLGLAGTPGYIAPEVIVASMHQDMGYSAKVDCWSLGCILMDMAHPTEEGGRAVERILQDKGYYVLNDTIRDQVIINHPSLVESSVAQEIVSNCLVEKPGARWSCADILEMSFRPSLDRALSEAIF